MKRRSKIERRTPLRRRERLRSRSPRRANEEETYAVRARAYLRAHPFCQIEIAALGLDEAAVIRFSGIADSPWGTFHVGRSNQIHHRNKRRRGRLLDERWWMAAGPVWHGRVESRKDWARSGGLLLPLEADPDGRLPDGTVCPTTAELLLERAQKGALQPFRDPF